MRTIGYCLLALGIVAEIMVLMLRLAGDPAQPVVGTLGLSMIVAGWKLKMYGKGTNPRKKASDSKTAVDLHFSSELENPSCDIPVTPAVSELISHQLRRTRKLMSIIVVTFAALGVLGGAALGISFGSPDGLTTFFVVAGAGLFVSAIVLGAQVFCQRLLQRDLHESTYLRTAGTVKLVSTTFGQFLALSDRAIPIERKSAQAVRNLNWATVDYSRHAKMVFAVWDRAGKLVYQFTGART